MARKKSKARKAHNAGKRIARLNQNLNAWTWQAQAVIEPGPHVRATTKINGSWIPVPTYQQRELFYQPMNWIVGMRALCVAGDGTVYVESVDVTLTNFRLKYLDDWKSNFRLMKILLEDLKRDHVVDVGWVAHAFSGKSWADDKDRMAAWMAKGLGWLPPNAPCRKREFDSLYSDFKQVFEELEKHDRQERINRLQEAHRGKEAGLPLQLVA